MKKENKITKSIRHNFTPDEVSALNIEFRQSFSNLKAVEAEFDNVKAVWKSKTTEAESRMETLNATLQAGFEMRQESCIVTYDVNAGKKHYFLESDPLGVSGIAVLTEPMTQADYEQELIQAESTFDGKEDIELFSPAGEDSGVLTVGRLAGKWFAALKVKIGTRNITERLDGEQACSKKRPDMVKRACKRFGAWLDENLGHDEAQGFRNSLALVVAAHAEREE